MHTLNRADTELVPILVKVQLLQARLLDEPDAFGTAWNWIDAFLRFEHNEPTYLMLRQAMASRRALLLLDGLEVGLLVVFGQCLFAWAALQDALLEAVAARAEKAAVSKMRPLLVEWRGAQRLGNAVLAACPKWLVPVQGTGGGLPRGRGGGAWLPTPAVCPRLTGSGVPQKNTRVANCIVDGAVHRSRHGSRPRPLAAE